MTESIEGREKKHNEREKKSLETTKMDDAKVHQAREKYVRQWRKKQGQSGLSGILFNSDVRFFRS